MVFKFETVVVTLIALAISTAVQAQDTALSVPGYVGTLGNQGATDCTPLLIKSIEMNDEASAIDETEPNKRRIDSKLKGAADLRAQYDACNARNESLTSDCGTANKKYTDTSAAFTAACGKAGVSSGSGDSAVTACGLELSRCDCGKNPNGPTCEGTEKEARRPRTKSTAGYTGAKESKALLSSETKRLSYCPSAAGEGLEKLEAQVDALNAALPEKKSKIGDLQEGLRSLKDSNTDALAGIEEQISAKKTAYDEELKALQDSADDEAERLAQEALRIKDRIAQLEADRRQADFEYQAAVIRQREAYAQADLVCWQKASADVEREQAAVIANFRQPRGDFSSFMNNVGVSSRAQWQRLAKRRFDECRRASPHKELKTSADKALGQSKEAYEDSLATIATAKTAAENELANTMSGNSCVGAGRAADNSLQGNKNCINAMKLVEARTDADNRYRTEMSRLTTLYSTKATQQSSALQAATKRLSDAERELSDEQTRLANYRELLSRKQEAAGNIPVSPEEAKEARAKFAELKSLADHVISCQKDQPCQPGQNCDKAKQFLSAVGLTPPEYPGQSSPVPGALEQFAGSSTMDAPSMLNNPDATASPSSRIPATTNPDGEPGAAEGNDSNKPYQY